MFDDQIEGRDVCLDFENSHHARGMSGDNKVSLLFRTPEGNKVPRKKGIEGLYYITHVNNVKSILDKGILCHDWIEREHVPYTRIYDTGIISRRKDIQAPSGKKLWEYANLYFQPRNAMLYRVMNSLNVNVSDIVILFVKPELVEKKGVFITTGNAASNASKFYDADDAKKLLKDISREVDRDWWNNNDGSKRKMMAECLVPERVSPDCIRAIYVGTEKGRSNLQEQIPSDIEVIVDADRFFLPQWKRIISPNLSLVKGDMFLSKMQTLTISVNCVGVMGKGIASTTKYRFPDVYVKYEDTCKKKKLHLGKPYIHRRETSVLYDLSDDPTIVLDNDSQTWFLIFPTKQHWRNNSDIDGIEDGMRWLLKNYKSEGIRSLALPALGCGLGKLEWHDVGPMMCKYLVQMDITSAIYLPIGKDIPDQYLTKEFLLSEQPPTGQMRLPKV